MASLQSWLEIKRGELVAGELSVTPPRAVRLLSVGKASLAMIEAAINILKDTVVSGILVVPEGQKVEGLDKRIEVFHASHPLPDTGGLRASMRVISSIERMGRDEMLVCLISGGASAMLPAPPSDIPLEDKRKVTQQLIRTKATIHEINTVRRHMSELKGGRLVELCKARTILSFMISDVPGNKLPDIGSGLTAPDPTTFRDAISVLKSLKLWKSIPRSVNRHLREGLLARIPDTPKPGNPIFRRVHNFIIADNWTACSAAKHYLETRRVRTRILTSSADMEARSLGSLLASIANDCERYQHRRRRSSAIIIGGETTVEVRGEGKGGRNQETTLSALGRIAGLEGIAIAAVGTDGIDGNSPAAGAIADGCSAKRASRLGLHFQDFLRTNDSYTYFKKLGDSIVTGRTGTNVGDLYIMTRVG